jgi:AraC-like DNA-binding protein
VTLEELSRIAEIGRYRLVRVFHREIGLPPHAYQIHLRIERSRDLLRRGVTGARIASELGFVDQPHFAGNSSASCARRRYITVSPKHLHTSVAWAGVAIVKSICYPRHCVSNCGDSR